MIGLPWASFLLPRRWTHLPARVSTFALPMTASCACAREWKRDRSRLVRCKRVSVSAPADTNIAVTTSSILTACSIINKITTALSSPTCKSARSPAARICQDVADIIVGKRRSTAARAFQPCRSSKCARDILLDSHLQPVFAPHLLALSLVLTGFLIFDLLLRVYSGDLRNIELEEIKTSLDIVPGDPSVRG